MAQDHEIRNMAVFCDFENVALGVEDAKYDKFDIRRVLEKLLVKGSIVVKKAYCDWDRYKRFKAAMHGASFELIEIPHVRQSGKNSADIRLVVDALDLCYTKSHVDTFVIVSGDSDFSPLVSKLRENAKTVIGVGVKNSTSDLLIANCDDFIYYDDLVREDEGTGKTRRKSTKKKTPVASSETTAGAVLPTEPEPVKPPAARVKTARKKAAKKRSPPAAAATAGARAAIETIADAGPAIGVEPDRRQEAIDLVVGIVEALEAERGENDKVWGSAVKQTLKRRNPGFNETYYGFRSFSALLEEAAKRRALSLEHDGKSGGYIVRSDRSG